jgi:hypothetical protein
MAERPLMNDVPEMALRNLEDTFGTCFMRHTNVEADAGRLFASVFQRTLQRSSH